MDWARAGGERGLGAGWGEAWNRRAPVKVPPEWLPPPLLTSLPELLEAPWLLSHNVVAPHLGLLEVPERSDLGFQQIDG